MSVLFRAVGDVGPNRADPGECFALCEELMRQADLGFCQLECNITDKGQRLPQVRHTHRAVPSAAQAIRDAGFQIVSFASNHCMDWGPDGFFDTVERLQRAGCEALGVGENIAAARHPVIRDVNGVRVAFVAACSILPAELWAADNRPGCVPMRAHTVYEQIETDQPGTPARIHTFAFKDDLAKLVQDVTDARAQADVVVVSLHWGIHFIPATIADYQIEVAHALVDAGANLIVGHHAHILKGLEVYRGKPIFYSVGNFAIDLPMTPQHAQSKGFKEIQALSPGWEPDFESLYNFPPDSRMTMIVEARFSKGGVDSVGFRPAFINRDAQPEPVTADDPRFHEIVDYMRWCTEEAGFGARFEPSGDLVQVI